MKVVETPDFARTVKRLHRNQRNDLNDAVRAIRDNPAAGVQKTGDLSWLRVYKFRMVNQLTLLAYELRGTDTIILHDVGNHENFYRDLKGR